jgi:hypothetical protein
MPRRKLLSPLAAVLPMRRRHLRPLGWVRRLPHHVQTAHCGCVGGGDCRWRPSRPSRWRCALHSGAHPAGEGDGGDGGDQQYHHHRHCYPDPTAGDIPTVCSPGDINSGLSRLAWTGGRRVGVARTTIAMGRYPEIHTRCGGGRRRVPALEGSTSAHIGLAPCP